MLARTKSFWLFQLICWFVAFGVLLGSGLSQTDAWSALIRNCFLFVAGFLSSFFVAIVIDGLRGFDELRLRLLVFPLIYVIAIACVVTINAITYPMQGVQLADVSWSQWFSGGMNFALVYWFWAELFIQKIYLKGRAGISAMEEQAAGPEKLVVDDDGSKVMLDLADIISIESAGDYVAIATSERVYLDRCTIQSMEDRLNSSGFLRVHRSAIVNLRHVTKLTPLGKGRYELHMSNDRTVSSSRRYEPILQGRFQ